MAKRNTFGPWQERQMAAREALIKEFLAQCRKSKASYPGITALASAVAEYVSSIEGRGEPCSTTTILRNPRYKSLLTHYLANQRGAKHVSPKALPDDRAKAIVTGLQLELLSLRQDNERLQRYVEALDKEMEAIKPNLPGGPPEATTMVGDSDRIKQLENDLGRTCMMITKILERFPDILAGETDFGRIVDLSVRKGRPGWVIAEEVDASPYFSWLRRNAGA